MPLSRDPAPRIVSAGNLGASYTLNLAGDDEVWLVGTLNANHALTISGAATGRSSIVKMLLAQDATGGRTLTVNDGGGAVAIQIPNGASEVALIDAYSPDGSDFYVVAVGAAGTDSDIVAIAALSPSNDDILQRKSGAWTNRTMAQVKTDLSLAKGDVGLGNVDNTTDANKPVSTAAQTALDLKANLSVTANTQTGNYTAVLSDAGKVVEMNVASANTFTIPPNSSVAFPTGTVIEVYQMGAGQTTLTPGSGVTLRERESKLKTAAQYATVSLRKRGTDEWVVAGDVAA